MGTAAIFGLVAIGIVLLVVGLGVVAKLTLRLMKGPLEARILAVHRPEEILMKDLSANSFGLESLGVWQGRGNGALVLTKDYLQFLRFVVGGDVRVPVTDITDITITKHHLGKATIYDLLKVHFTLNGQPDSIAWYLADPIAWKKRLEELRASAAVAASR